MTYIRDLHRELDERLRALEEVWREGSVERRDAARADCIRFVKEKALESYRNGLNAVTARVNAAERTLEHAKARAT